jgi:hypothetical protein
MVIRNIPVENKQDKDELKKFIIYVTSSYYFAHFCYKNYIYLGRKKKEGKKERVKKRRIKSHRYRSL